MAEPKLHLFIDTNIFLSFYAYTNDDVEELRKLISLIKTNQLKLYLTGKFGTSSIVIEKQSYETRCESFANWWSRTVFPDLWRNTPR